MSRIGKQPIVIPPQVTIEISDYKVMVKGPKGQLEQQVLPEIKVEVKDNKIYFTKTVETRRAGCFHGLFRTLVANNILGVTQGFFKTLELHGTGYRASIEDNKLKILIGFSHPVIIEPVEGIQFEVEDNNIIKISGIDKQLVGQVAAKIRDIRKPEPYKGKGIRYQGEKVRRKAGKAAKSGAEAGA